METLGENKFQLFREKNTALVKMSASDLDEVLKNYMLPFKCRCVIATGEQVSPDKIYDILINWHFMHLIRDFVCWHIRLKQPEKLWRSMKFSSKSLI